MVQDVFFVLIDGIRMFSFVFDGIRVLDFDLGSRLNRFDIGDVLEVKRMMFLMWLINF